MSISCAGIILDATTEKNTFYLFKCGILHRKFKVYDVYFNTFTYYHLIAIVVMFITFHN